METLFLSSDGLEDSRSTSRLRARGAGSTRPSCQEESESVSLPGVRPRVPLFSTADATPV